MKLHFNRFVPNAPFLHPLKTSENYTSGGRERVHWERMELQNSEVTFSSALASSTSML